MPGTKPESELEEWEKCSNLNGMKFADVAERFERADAPMKGWEKLAIVFDEEVERVTGRQSTYPLVRLLLPSLDNGRRTFGIKVKGLAKVYLKLTGLEKANVKSNEAARKLKYHAGDAAARGQFEGAELGNSVRDVSRRVDLRVILFSLSRVALL